ncbi:MAG: tetratricopeptide repeat protein, partial [Alphaproteobacteria bacterium]|nr:tetratricopeptide repeat protein [Alphaproteobacteria bacterium]
MVRLWLAGGGLTTDIATQLEEAARRHSQGDAAGALALYRGILAQSPREPEALLGMGVIAKQAGNADLALKLIRAAIAARQDYAAAWVDLSLVLRETGSRAEAEEAARIAAQCNPSLPGAWDALGLALKDSGSYAEAASCFERAIDWQPDDAHIYGNYAALLFAMGDLHGACLAGCKAEHADPQWPPMILGNSLRAMGYPELAARRFAQTRRLQPGFAEAAVSEAMARLQMGDMEQGWALWEQRPDLADEKLAVLPLWNGDKNMRIIVYEDQGMGDALHFARYIPWLCERTDIATLQLAAPLRALFAENFPDIPVIAADAALPAADARCRLSSLSFFAATRIDTIPSAPYLTASEDRRRVWKERLQPIAAPRIGLVWAGNARFHNDGARSLPFDMLHILLDKGMKHFVSLQKERSEMAASADLFDAASMLQDFADTAALISELDLVITVDTAVAHLAGALGKPAWILLPFDADWRWLLGREDSPWYASARLFRQNKP